MKKIQNAEESAPSDIENRIKNLIWAVSGDYGLELKPDIDSFRISEAISLYDAVRQGAFARYFDLNAFGQYLNLKIRRGAEPSVLFPLAKLCMESAVWKKAAKERPGILDLRSRAFKETLEKESRRLSHTHWGSLEAAYLRFSLDGEVDGEEKKQFISLLCSLQDVDGTEDVIHGLNQIYDGIYAKGFADKFEAPGQFGQIDGAYSAESGEEDGAGEEQKEAVFDLFTDQLLEEDSKQILKKNAPVLLDDESFAHLEHYVELNYGKSYLPKKEQRSLSRQLCTGAHSDCRLHFTDGLLNPEEQERPQTLFAEKIREENTSYYYENFLVARQNIKSLSDLLNRAMLLQAEREFFYSDYGSLCVNKLWNIGRTNDRKLFKREFSEDAIDFAVEILIDASGSQQSRQSQVALQGYILSAALSSVHIPHRVMGFCTFGDCTILRRYRDYDEGENANERIFEFYGSANNRDGLAIRAAAESLFHRKEKQKLLIVLSDGVPNDIITSRKKSGKYKPYVSDYAVRDTAAEVLSLKTKGITVLGILVGSEDSLPSEKRIFGNGFAHIQSTADFANIVGRYLKGQITR